MKPGEVSSADFETKDGGERVVYATGAQREPGTGKGRFDLISPRALRRLAKLYERGAEKYGASNMRKGMPVYRYLDSAERHLNEYKDGDRSEDHLAAVAWNAFELIHTLEAIERGELPRSLLDAGRDGANEPALP